MMDSKPKSPSAPAPDAESDARSPPASDKQPEKSTAPSAATDAPAPASDSSHQEKETTADGASASAAPASAGEPQLPPPSDAHDSVPPTQDAATEHPANAAPPEQNNAFGLPPHGLPTEGAFPPSNMMMPGISDQTMAGMNGTSSQQLPGAKDMSADEIALYDRQIRLWGIQAQKKISGANIVLVTMKALANEIAKNLVLAGIGSLTILDDQVVTETDLGAQFFLTQDKVGQNRAEAVRDEVQKLNPRVKVFADPGNVMTKGVSYFAAFDIVIATDSTPTTLAFLNTVTRLHSRQFYAAGCHGLYGFIFCDLIEHDFVLKRDSTVSTKIGPETRTRSVTEVKKEKEGDKEVELVAKRELYSTWDLAAETSFLPPEFHRRSRLRAVTPALSCLRALWAFQGVHGRNPGRSRPDLEFFTKTATQCHQMLGLPGETLKADFLRSFLQNIGSEIAPVTAVLGGQLAQDVINVLGQSQQPIQNMVLFDGEKMEASQYPLHPEGPLGRAQLDPSNPGMQPMAMDQPLMDPSMLAAQQMGSMPPMGDPQMMNPMMANPQMMNPQMGGPQLINPQMGDPSLVHLQANPQQMMDQQMGTQQMQGQQMVNPSAGQQPPEQQAPRNEAPPTAPEQADAASSAQN